MITMDTCLNGYVKDSKMVNLAAVFRLRFRLWSLRGIFIFAISGGHCGRHSLCCDFYTDHVLRSLQGFGWIMIYRSLHLLWKRFSNWKSKTVTWCVTIVSMTSSPPLKVWKLCYLAMMVEKKAFALCINLISRCRCRISAIGGMAGFSWS